MNKPLSTPLPPISDWRSASVALMNLTVADMAGRLARLLMRRFPKLEGSMEVAVNFLESQARSNIAGSDNEQLPIKERCRTLSLATLSKIEQSLALSELELQTIILAGMAEHHEGFADIFRSLHPQHQPYPTVGLAAQLLCQSLDDRVALRHALAEGSLRQYQLLNLSEQGPFFNRDLVMGSRFWNLLLGISTTGYLPCQGIDVYSQWLRTAAATDATLCLQTATRCAVLIIGDELETAYHRSLALCEAASRPAMAIAVDNDTPPETVYFGYQQCLGLDAVPLIKFSSRTAEGGKQAALLQALNAFPSTLLLACETGRAPTVDRLTIVLTTDPLPVRDVRNWWSRLVPELASEANELSARFPVEPFVAKQSVDDARLLARHSDSPISLEALAERFKSRAYARLSPSVQLIRPVSSWEQLVLPQTQLQQMEEAVCRLHQQGRVLDDWHFLAQRRGARGVRMLFSGPPGTGKTLSAEVMAKALNADLLLVDLSQVVSKWIGETEKNLADVFACAEAVKAVLFFDEADALFGKRTEVSDAHDRYANMETAYLLSRLERYDGLTILATNFRKNIDTAFLRRLEYVIEFREPSAEERALLWRCHVPGDVPLAGDVDFAELSAHFAIVGGLIRNAAVAAGYMAAREDSPLAKRHFLQAIRREYEKSGKAFREVAVS